MLRPFCLIVIIFSLFTGLLQGAPVCIDGVCAYEPAERTEIKVFLLTCSCAPSKSIESISDFFVIEPADELPAEIPPGAFLIIGKGACSEERAKVFDKDHIIHIKGKTLYFRDKEYSVERQEELIMLKEAMKNL